MRGELFAHCEQIGAAPDAPEWPSDTWTGVCGWLEATLPRWWHLPQGDRVASDINRIHAELRDLARIQREPVYCCPKCRDAMRLQPGGQWLRCDSGHEESADLEARYRRRPLTPAAVLADEFGIDPALIRKWKHRNRLVTKTRGGELWAYPWDVLLLSNPAIAEAVARREAITQDVRGSFLSAASPS